MKRLAKFIYIEGIGLVILSILFWQYRLPVQAATELKTISQNPATAYFSSPSTSQGKRRFLAIGNFFDTTNQAYFTESVSYLEFKLQLTPDQLVKRAFLNLTKYASSSTGPTNILANLQLNQNTTITSLGAVAADSGDYDFDILSWDLSEQVQNYLESGQTIQQVNFSIETQNPIFHQGIAVCSGNNVDEICPVFRFPKLVIEYVDNTIGSLVSKDLPQKKIFNLTDNSELVDCEIQQGCNFKLKVNYQDTEENGKLKLKTIDLVSSNAILEKQLNLHNFTQVLEFPLADGDYLISLTISDGSHEQVIIEAEHWLVDTIPPEKPSLLYHSALGSRKGVVFLFATASEVLNWQVKLFSPENILLETSSCEDIDCQIDPVSILTDNFEYQYELRSIDRAGNFSESLSLKILQQNNLLSPIEIRQTAGIISPANKDGKFDLTTINFEFVESIVEPIVTVHDNKFRQLKSLKLVFQNNSSSSLGFDFAGDVEGKLLADGQYFFKLQSRDKYGYPIAEQLLKVIVDNTSPIIKEFRVT